MTPDSRRGSMGAMRAGGRRVRMVVLVWCAVAGAPAGCKRSATDAPNDQARAIRDAGYEPRRRRQDYSYIDEPAEAAA